MNRGHSSSQQRNGFEGIFILEIPPTFTRVSAVTSRRFEVNSPLKRGSIRFTREKQGNSPSRVGSGSRGQVFLTSKLIL